MNSEWTEVGWVFEPHSMRGQLKISLYQRFKNINLNHFEQLQIDSKVYSISELKSQKKWWISSLEGLDTREAAEALRKKPIYLELDQIQEKLFYVGFILKNKELETIGRIIEIMEYPTHKNLIVKTQPKVNKIEVPYVPDWILEVNESEKWIVMDIPLGLDEL